MLLLLGRYSEEMSSWESNAIVRQYKEVTQVHQQWEDGYFYMGQYYDKIMSNLGGVTVRSDQKGWSVLMHSCRFMKRLYNK